MKKLILVFIGLIGMSTIQFGQADKDMKSAQKNLTKFYQDISGDPAVLIESVSLLESAFSSDEVAAVTKNWITKGKIYGELANSEFKSKTLDPAYAIQYPDAAMNAYTAFTKAGEMAEKKSEIRDVSSGLAEVENHLNNAAIFAYQEQNYADAFANFNASIGAYDMIKAKGGKSRLEEGTLYKDQLFFAAASGYYGQKYAEAKPIFEKLLEMDSDEALVYEGMYNIAKSEGDEDAVRYLSMGREKFPDDTGLLFQEINFYLNAGKLSELIGKLEQAIEKEPENITVHVTLGNVYDQLSAKSLEDGNPAEAQEYFDKALMKYSDALKMDEGNFDATYSIGALHYNKAATMVDDLNDLASDLTPAGMKKYDAKKAEMDEEFNAALPFFEKAASIKSDDINTVIALKEIYAKLNMMDKSNEYKAKYEKLAGQQ